ncbi:MAG TPA: TonB-dependent receptor, partial [Ohtaekwangia sp.]
VRYSLNDYSSIKFSYDKTYQYMHMAPLSSVSLPLDVWVPSSSIIKPQYAHQWSAGYFRNFMDHKIETSVVLYYKNMYNQLEYREGVIIGYSKGFNFDDNFVFGKGTSYGSEFLIKKTSGRLNGQLAYTLSKTMRTFDALNKGKAFPAKYDRLHDLSIMANFRYNPKWTFSCVFVYATGNALNLPVARYVIQGNIVNEYGDRNSFRMPAYHRLDVSVTHTLHKSEQYESFLILSIYNLYSRKNPYYVYFETEGNLQEYELRTSIKQVSLFPIIPAITYRVKF